MSRGDSTGEAPTDVRRACPLLGVEQTSTSAVEFHPLYLVAITGAGRAPVASRPGASGSLFSARGLNVRFWGHTEPPFAFYSESFFGIRREGGGETPMQLLLEGGAGEAGSRSKEAKSNAISDGSFAA